MLARVNTFTIEGVDGCRVTVEVDIRSGLPALTIVGLGDKAVQESRQRVCSAIKNAGFPYPQQRITVNLAPASLRKGGPGFDLAIAVGILAAAGEIDCGQLGDVALIGELSLAGEVGGVPGTLAFAQAAQHTGCSRILVADERAAEAALVHDIEVIPVRDLAETIAVLSGYARPRNIAPLPATTGNSGELDMADVRGHEGLMPALAVAAAGGHNLMLHGPPGTGKTMLIRRLPTIMPVLTTKEAIDVAKIYSVAGILRSGTEFKQRPFRSPHHTTSAPGLVGGGTTPRPGEVTLAHNGVLFLDELPEFSRSALQALRQPLQDREVTIVRGNQTVRFPSRVMFVAAANPCPCSDQHQRCQCTGAELAHYRRKLSGALLDRLDISLSVDRPKVGVTKPQLESESPTSSGVLRAQVAEGYERLARCYEKLGIEFGGEIPARRLVEFVEPTRAAEVTLGRLIDRLGISARGQSRILRVAKTIASLDQRQRVESNDMQQAASYRVN